MRTITLLDGEAYPAQITRLMTEFLGREVGLDQVVVVIQRLVKKGYIASDHMLHQIDTRRRPVKFYKVTKEGGKSFDETLRMWQGLVIQSDKLATK